MYLNIEIGDQLLRPYDQPTIGNLVISASIGIVVTQ